MKVVRFHKKMTYREKYEPAMSITEQKEADAYFKQCVDHRMKMNSKLTYAEAICIEKKNLGYFAGYYDYETMKRVNKLFNTVHPIFG